MDSPEDERGYCLESNTKQIKTQHNTQPLVSMEGSSSSFKPSDQNPTAGNISSLLAGLPSRGLFSSTSPSSSFGRMRVYLCEHDTAPPEDQQIKTDQKNILIRSLTIRKQKTESASKVAAAGEGSKKRNAEKTLESQSSAKRANTGSSSYQGAVTSFPADFNFQSLTVERLRALLRERGLSLKGRKDELVARLRAANN